jgi:hypothetical protein
MRPTRLLAALAAALAVLAVPGTAHAATITQPFAADSGDACRYGATSGTLGWRYGTLSPLPVVGVDVKGQLTDRPLPSDPSATCRDDGFNSTATFTAYAGSVAVDRQSRTADNATVSFQFTLGGNTASTHVDRVVVQVCRSPIVTLPPSYCGKAVTYLAPPIA